MIHVSAFIVDLIQIKIYSTHTNFIIPIPRIRTPCRYYLTSELLDFRKHFALWTTINISERVHNNLIRNWCFVDMDVHM